MKRIELTCVGCGLTRWSNGRNERCNPCATILKYEKVREERFTLLKSMYTNVSRAEVTSYGKTAWKFTHAECGTEQTWTDSNLTKQLDLHPSIAPCKKCGAKRRTEIATAAYVAKYGLSEERLKEWEGYRSHVRHLTEQTYRLHKDTINPLDLPRGLTTYHLDHKFPIIEGFLQGHPPEMIARLQNLQLLPATQNLMKGRRV